MVDHGDMSGPLDSAEVATVPVESSSPGGCPPEPSQIRARRFPPLGSSVEQAQGARAQTLT